MFANSLGTTWKIHKDPLLEWEDPPVWEELKGVRWGFTAIMKAEHQLDYRREIDAFLLRAKLLANGRVIFTDDHDDDILCEWPTGKVYEINFWFEHKEDRDRLWQLWIGI